MTAAVVDAWLAARPEDQRVALERLRGVLRTCLPEAEEVISYAMPGFRLGRKMVAGYAGFARNCGYYPHSGSVVPRFATELDRLGFRHTDGAISFTPDKTLPDDLVQRLVAARLAEIGAA